MTRSKDKYLLVPKALYFLCSCFMYAPALYQAKYLEEIWKIKSHNYGFMNLVTVFSILASLSWSGLADRYRAHKKILMVKSILYGFSYCSMWFLEPFIKIWNLNTKILVILFIFFTTTVFCSAIFPLLGTLVFSILENTESLKNGLIPPKRLLGRQKLFGTLGVGLVYSLNGTLTEFIGYRAQFLIVSLTSVAFFLISYFGLENPSSLSKDVSLIDKEKEAITNANDCKDSASNSITIPTTTTINTKTLEKPSWIKNVKALLGNWEFVNLLFIVFLIGVSGSVFNVYFSIFMGKLLPQSKWENTLMGTMNTSRLIVEIPIYIWGNELIGQFGSYGVLLMGMIASCIRPFGYSLFVKDESSAKYGFFIELFKGFSHACNGLGGCVLASDLAPSGAQGTAQALFTSAHHHAASTITGLLCTLFLNYRNYDGSTLNEQITIFRDLFFCTGIIGVLGVIINIYRLVKYRKNQDKRKE